MEEDENGGLLRKDTLLEVLNILLDGRVNREQSEDAELEDVQSEQQVKNWLEEWHGNLKHDDLLEDTGDGQSRIGVVPALFHLLRECLLTHRWSEVTQVMTCVTTSPDRAVDTILKVGMEVIQQKPGDNLDLLQQLILQLKDLNQFDFKEVIIEYALHLLNQGLLQEAKHELTHVAKRRKGAPKPYNAERDPYIQLLLKAYQGLVFYVEWGQAKHQLQKLRGDLEEMDIYEESTQIMNKERMMHVSANKAMECFNILKHTPGIWDIFINKHVELLEFCDEKDEAFDLLQSYAEKNPDNPNAKRYIYMFHKRHNHDIKLQTTALQEFCDAVPSDVLALELHQLYLKQGEKPAKLVYLLFDLLDFVCWQNEVHPWKLLAEQLLTIYRSESHDTKEIDQCWRVRDTWWPNYHFRADSKAENLKCCVYKAVVASILIGQDNAYTSHIKKLCSEKEHLDLLQEAQYLRRETT